MNIYRGLHRLFLVLAGCWILIVGLTGNTPDGWVFGIVSAGVLYAITFGVAWIVKGFRP